MTHGDSAASIHRLQQEFFRTGETRRLEFRLSALRKLERLINEHEQQLIEALRLDLGKSRFESCLSEIDFVVHEIRQMIRNLPKLVRPSRVSSPLMIWKSKSRIEFEPHGNTLIIGPWNYPFQLLITPLVGAIAGGNTAVVKPSEITSNVSAVIARMLSSFDKKYIAVIEGGVQETQQLLAQRFDYFFFTGSTQVGKIVLRAAAEHMVPSTLELGGKSPCVVDRDIPVRTTARRLVWGKFFNAGQTCVAPDYLLVQRGVKEELIGELSKAIGEFYGPDPSQSADYGRIVSARHFDRLSSLMVPGEGKVVHGGRKEADSRYFEPTLVDEAKLGHRLMDDEIFGPILPILEYDEIEEALKVIDQRSEPLSFYVFSRNQALCDHLFRTVRFGGACANDTLIHLSNSALPFGGVGRSGIGAYHGKFSFQAFTRPKAILHRSLAVDPPLRYPPISERITSISRFFVR